MQQFKWAFLLSLTFLFFSQVLQAQTIKATNAWKSGDFKSTINVEDDLLIYAELDKTLMMSATERGLDATGMLYVIVKINMDGAEQIAGPLMFMNTTTMTAQSIPFVMNVQLEEFKALLMSRKGEMDMGDLGMLTIMGATNSTQKTWISLLAGNAVAGSEKNITTELFLVKDEKSKEPLGKALASGSFKCKITKEGLDKLYSSGRIPERFKPTPDDGVTSDFHKKNLNKIVWNNTTLSKTATAGGTSTCSSLAGGLYGRVYLPKSLRNYGVIVGKPDNCVYSLKFYKDGKLVGETGSTNVDKDACQKATTWSFTLAPSSGDSQKADLVGDFATFLKTLKEGTHTLRVDLVMDYFSDDSKNESMKLASSDLTLTLNKSDKEAFEKKYAPVYEYTGSSSASGGKKVTIYVENKSGSTAKYEYSGNGMTGSGSFDTISKNRVTLPHGYFLKVNGRDWRKFSPSDEGKVFQYK